MNIEKASLDIEFNILEVLDLNIKIVFFQTCFNLFLFYFKIESPRNNLLVEITISEEISKNKLL